MDLKEKFFKELEDIVWEIQKEPAEKGSCIECGSNNLTRYYKNYIIDLTGNPSKITVAVKCNDCKNTMFSIGCVVSSEIRIVLSEERYNFTQKEFDFIFKEESFKDDLENWIRGQCP